MPQSDIPAAVAGYLGGVFIKMNYNRFVIDRDLYRLSDWAQDIGGFFGFFSILAMIIVPLISAQTLEKQLIRNLFKRVDEEDKDEIVRQGN